MRTFATFMIECRNDVNVYMLFIVMSLESLLALCILLDAEPSWSCVLRLPGSPATHCRWERQPFQCCC